MPERRHTEQRPVLAHHFGGGQIPRADVLALHVLRLIEHDEHRQQRQGNGERQTAATSCEISAKVMGIVWGDWSVWGQ